MTRHTETRRLQWALAISSMYFFAELVAGFLTNSLALLSDAGHMLSDIGALSLSLFAFRMARRPATLHSTYGYHRIEILAALFNGLTLWLIVGIIFAAAYSRLSHPPEIESFGMMVVAILGLLVNLTAAIILHGGHHHNLNLRGAFLHVVSDAVGSVGAIVAGVITGGLGGYTTFSSMQYDAVTLAQKSRSMAVAYLVLSVLAGLGAAALGVALARMQG